MSDGYDNKGMDVEESRTKPADEHQVKLSFKEEDPCKRTKLEIGLIFFVLTFLFVIIGLIVAVVILRKADEKQEICETPECTLAAAQLLDSMDQSADPCEDFYQYACGSWKRKHIIPEDRTSYSMFAIIEDDVSIVNKYLLEDTEHYSDVEGVVKAKDMYTSCVDLDKIEAKNSSVAIPFLNELGGWPVLESNPGGNWTEDDFNLTQLLILLNKYINRHLIDMYVSADVKETEEYVIYLDQPGFGLPGRLYYLLDSLSHMREAYVTLATTAAVLFGANETTAEREMREILDFETDIANITMKLEDRRDSEALYNRMTITELKQNFTEPAPTDPVQFDWLEFISGVFDLEGVKIPINESEEVIVRAVPYFQKLFGVLQKHGKRVINNYLVWRIMMYRINNLDSRFRDILTEYYNVIYGTTSPTVRWKDCLDYTTAVFGMAVGHMFVKETFDENARTEALEMIGNIRAAFNELLEEVDWMDEPTKELAREKEKALKEWIGYPEGLLDPDQISELYENVTIDKDDYFKNILSNLKLAAVEGLRELRNRYDKNIWTTPPSTVNALYSGIRNTIMFPAGIFQPPIYQGGRLKSLNYGGIGMVIGHELTHGFDDRGRQYDKNGDLQEWWDAEIIENFKEKAQCMIDQYGNFTVPEVDLNINGINTQGENIADNGGLKQSFRAYRQWINERGSEEPTLPGVNLTNNQLFFVNFAQVWCRNVRKESLINEISNGYHSPGRFRVIGTLQNSAEFSAAFRCKKNDYMNPEKKCYVW